LTEIQSTIKKRIKNIRIYYAILFTEIKKTMKKIYWNYNEHWGLFNYHEIYVYFRDVHAGELPE